MKRTIILIVALLLAGCGQAVDEPPKAEPEVVSQEGIQKVSDQEEKEDEQVSSRAESANKAVRTQSAGEWFDDLPDDIRIALLTPYFDERGQPENIDGSLYIHYGIGDDYALIQVHSGAGSGHPVYKIQRQADTFQAIDGVVYMGSNGYEAVSLPSVLVTADQLRADYEKNPDLYEEAADYTQWDTEYLNLVLFEKQKSMIGQSESVPDSSQSEEMPTFEEGAVQESEKDLHYDGDLGDSGLYPDQPMFIDGVLYSGDTNGIPSDLTVTADDLRASGYTVYELSYGDYDRLMQEIRDSVIPHEEALSHYLSNY